MHWNPCSVCFPVKSHYTWVQSILFWNGMQWALFQHPLTTSKSLKSLILAQEDMQLLIFSCWGLVSCRHWVNEVGLRLAEHDAVGSFNRRSMQLLVNPAALVRRHSQHHDHHKHAVHHLQQLPHHFCATRSPCPAELQGAFCSCGRRVHIRTFFPSSSTAAIFEKESLVLLL